MSKQDIIKFFNDFAPRWDADMVRNEQIIVAILENARIWPGVSVLDVGCGTGVLIPDYLTRDVSLVTAVDISPEMIACAREKFALENVHLICADVETYVFEAPFDRVIIYNAFPHFFHPAQLIKKLAGDLIPGGVLTVAHGMSRAALDNHHSGSADKVSIDLMHEDDLEKLFIPYFDVIVKISSDQMYQVAGIKK